MKELLEKLKALDKKVWIIAGAVAVAVIALVITLVLVLGGSGDAPDTTETNATTTTVATKTTTATKVTTTTKATTTTKPTTTTVVTTTVTTLPPTEAPTAPPTEAPTLPPTEAPTAPPTEAPTLPPTEAPTAPPTEAPTAPPTTVATTPAPTEVPTTAATQPTNAGGDEILGMGSKDEPYLETPALDTMTVKTVDIPAGKSLYYSIYRVGNMILTIENANAYVVCDGVRYDANGGKVSFTVPDALASDAVSFEIGNSGSAAASFTIRFENQKGSQMDPVIVNNLGAENKVSLAKNASQGYYYKYTAQKNGKIRLYMTASVDSVLFATNNRNSAQRTTEADALTDANGRSYIELEVQAGDEIIVNVGAKPDKRGKYPATEITWRGEYV